MEDTGSAFTEAAPSVMEAAPSVTDSGMGLSTPTSGYTYTDPISSFFNGIFFIIILFLLVVFLIIILIGSGLGIFKSGPAPPPVVKKEKFKNGPPYPSCRTNGAFAMF